MTGYELLQMLSKCDLDLPVVMDCNDMKYDAVACLMETEGKEKMITLYSVDQQMSETETKATRKCSHCGKEITEGYVIDGGDEYYCSDRCLHRHHSTKEYEKKYAHGDGDSYWTIFEEEAT